MLIKVVEDLVTAGNRGAAILAYAFFSMIATWGLKDKSRSNVTPRILKVGSISMDSMVS